MAFDDFAGEMFHSKFPISSLLNLTNWKTPIGPVPLFWTIILVLFTFNTLIYIF